MIASFNSLLQTRALYDCAFFNVGQGDAVNISTRQTALEPSVAGADIPMSWSGWFRISNFPSQAVRLFQNAYTASNVSQYVCSLIGGESTTKSQVLRMNLFTDASNFITVDTVDRVLKGRWFHLVITYGGGEVNTDFEIYINSVQQSVARSTTGSYTGAHNNASLRFGLSRISAASPQTRYAGDVRDFAVWSTKLDQTEVNELYNSGVLRDVADASFYADIIADYPLRSNFNCINNATYNMNNTLGAPIFHQRPFSVRQKTLTTLNIDPDNARYMIGNNLLLMNSDTAFIFPRSGTDHVLNGRRDKFAITLSTLSASNPVTVLTDGTYDLRNGSSAVIDGKIFQYYARYNGGTNAFIDLQLTESTDGLTGETYAAPSTPTDILDRFQYYGWCEGFSAGHYFFVRQEGNTAGTDRRLYLVKTEDDGATWGETLIWQSGTENLTETNIINLGSNTLLFLARSEDGGLYQITSTDGGSTFSSPVLTNLTTELGNAAMALDEQGRMIVLFMNRTDGFLYMSQKNYVATILASPTSYVTPSAIVKSYIADSLGILGYPSIVRVKGRIFLISYCLEASSSKADIYFGLGTMFDN